MRLILVIALLVLLAYFPVAFLQKTFYYGDNYSLMVPGKLFAVESLKQGVLPFWNPYQMGGQPFLADFNQSVFYPSTALFVLLPTWIAVNATVLLHMCIGAVGVYFVVKRKTISEWLALVGPAVWIFSSQVVMAANNLAAIQTTAWIPWVYYFTSESLEKRTLLPRFALAASLVLAVLGGHPQPLFYFTMFLLIYVLCYTKLTLSEKLQRFGLMGLLVIGTLTAVLLPFIELSNLSTRAQMSVETVLQGSLHPAQLVSWVIPNFFMDLSSGLAWGPAWYMQTNDSGYMTVFGLVAIAVFISKKKKSYEERFMLWTAGISIIIALGRYLPFMSTVYESIPLLRLFRNPVVVMWLWTLCTSILVVPAISFLATKLKRIPRTAILFLALAGVTSVLLVLTQHLWFVQGWNGVDAVLHGKLSQSAFHTIERDLAILVSVMYSLSMVCLSTASLLFAVSGQKKRWMLLCVVMAADLFLAARPSMLFAPSSVYERESKQAEALMKHLQPGERYISSTGYLDWSGFPTYWENVAVRPPFQESPFTLEESHTFTILRQRRANLGPNWGQVAQLPTPFGFSTIVLSQNADYWKTATASSNVNEVDKPTLDDVRFAQQSVKYVVLDTTMYPTTYLTEKYPQLSLVEAGDGFALFSLPRTEAFVRAVEGEVEISSLKVSGNTINFSAKTGTSDPMSLIVAERYYPGWNCSISQGSCTVKPDEQGMRVETDAMTADITLWFEPTNWRLFAHISAFSGVLLLVFGLYAWKRDHSR